VTTVSSCLDCGTTVIGERARCPACHDHHATELADDVVTAPRTRTRQRRITRDLLPSFLVAWIVGFEFVAIIALAIVFMVKGCPS
jgi:hypothetical protein